MRTDVLTTAHGGTPRIPRRRRAIKEWSDQKAAEGRKGAQRFHLNPAYPAGVEGGCPRSRPWRRIPRHRCANGGRRGAQARQPGPTRQTHTASESAHGGALRQRHIAHERRASGASLTARAKRSWAVRKVRSGPQQED
jgi:hypothetical protein